jgi:hypothetical protein
MKSQAERLAALASRSGIRILSLKTQQAEPEDRMKQNSRTYAPRLMLTALLISVLLGSCASSGTYESESLEPAVSYGLFDSFEDLYYRVTAETNPSVEQLSPTFPWTGDFTFTALRLAGASTEEPGLVFYQAQGQEPQLLGLVQTKKGERVYGYDFTREMQIVYEDDILIAPYDAYSTANIPRDDRSDYRIFWEPWYNIFQTDAGPSAPEAQATLERIIGEMVATMMDPSAPNRDIIYPFLYYQVMFMREPIEGYASMGYLLETSIDRFGTGHLLFLLFMYESMINADAGIDVRPYIGMHLENDPDFIPALVYDMRFEEDARLQEAKLADLRKNHSDHWIVRTLR